MIANNIVLNTVEKELPYKKVTMKYNDETPAEM